MCHEETLILLGDSPFLTEIQDKILYVLNRFPSMGINAAVLKYPVKYHVFSDLRVAYLSNKFPNVMSVTNKACGSLLKKDAKELIDSYSFSIKEGTSSDIIKGDKLAWCGFTHDYAVSWAIWKGFKKVILIGAADFVKGNHHVLGGSFKFSEVLAKNSIKFLSDICSEKIEIMTCNPDSVLRIPRISIEDLLI